MDEADVVRALGALAQETRLRIFRMLVVAGPKGVLPGQMAEALGSSPSSERDGRHLIYRASIPQMNGLLGFLTAHCCEGQPCEVNAVACNDCS
jgi:ArsR family transcriptional regulator